MDWAAIQSSSLAAVKTVMGNQSFDVLWKNQYESGYVAANTNVRIELIQDDVISSDIRFFLSGNVLSEKEWQNRRLTFQYNVSTLTQTMVSSSNAIASKIRGGLNLQPIQDLFALAGLSPSNIGSTFIVDEVKDRQRMRSQAAFEVTFNAVEIVTIANHDFGFIDAVEWSGSLSGSASGGIITIADFVSGAFHPSGVAPATDLTGLMDEGLIIFNNESEKTVSFNFVFPDEPHAIVFSLSDTTNGQVYSQGGTFTSASFDINISAPWSGSIRYRAIWSNVRPNYPATVTSSLHPASGVLSASVRRLHTKDFTGMPKVDWDSYYWALSSQPQEFFVSHWSLGHNTGIPVITTDGFDTNNASGSIATAFSIPGNNSAGTLHHAAFVSGS